jgi:hypothetical protein
MLQTISTLGAVPLAITGLMCVGILGAAAAPRSSGANVAQVDRTTTWVCPSPTDTTGDFFDVPDVALSLTTSGGPVLLMINLSWQSTAGTGVWLEPVIDGQQRSIDRLSWQTDNDGCVDMVLFQRVYSISGGTVSYPRRYRASGGADLRGGRGGPLSGPAA